MKLTIEIPDAHTGDVLRYLAGLIPSAVEQVADPAPDHPELPLEDEADTRWCIAAADPLKVAMDDPVDVAEEITRHEINNLVEATDREMLPRLIPEPGKSYRLRRGIIAECIEICSTSIRCEVKDGPLYYLHDGTPRGGIGRAYDCVEEIEA